MLFPLSEKCPQKTGSPLTIPTYTRFSPSSPRGKLYIGFPSSSLPISTRLPFLKYAESPTLVRRIAGDQKLNLCHAGTGSAVGSKNPWGPDDHQCRSLRASDCQACETFRIPYRSLENGSRSFCQSLLPRCHDASGESVVSRRCTVKSQMESGCSRE